MDRTETLTCLKKNPNLDVLVVGAGINGAGTFRDLALQGVRVLLIDRGDICSGASAASSHMAHGGIRYLENGEFRLVREAVQERNRMIENAPHLVRPLPTTIPIFKLLSGLLNAPLKFLGWLDRPAERGALVIKIGLIFYDAFTRRQGTVPRHTFRGRRSSLETFPRLNPRVRNTATYYDGAILSPERLNLEIVLDGEAEGGHALVLNYVELQEKTNDGIVLKDGLSGKMLTVRPRLVINAAGPWIDRVNERLGLQTHYIGGTKGSHLVLDNPELREAIGENEFFFENRDGRIVLIFPLGERVLIGTSDIPAEDPDQVRCTPEEEAYFLNMVGRVFPDIPASREQIVFRFAGVRPLEYSHAKTTGQISRDHSLLEDEAGGLPVWSLVGGKWTSYRAFAEQAADRALALLARPRLSSTAKLRIGGGRPNPTAQANAELQKRYGSRARLVLEFLQAGQDAPLRSLQGWTRREIGFLALEEKVVHLDDLLMRRTMLAVLGQINREVINETGEVLAEFLGWDSRRRTAEVRRAKGILADRHGLQLA